MSKYGELWRYLSGCGSDTAELTFAQIGEICGYALDHSFLREKKDLLQYGYEVAKISMKKQTVLFRRIRGEQ